MEPIAAANEAYERWLEAQLGGDIVRRDLARKHEKMADGPFPFLRATYWRWAEVILDICPDLAAAPPVLAVGDIHLENFGSWRDRDGRLVWGVNDIDECAEMPYPLDLVRLAASALLARPSAPGGKAACAAILDGYAGGLDDPVPFVIEEKHPWLRDLVVATDAQRQRFWEKIDALERPRGGAPDRYRRAIADAMPERGLDIRYRPRSAGTGSLGRPRWIGVADWRGGRVVREAKALVGSGWTRAHGGGDGQSARCQAIAHGRYRAPDPWYGVADDTVVRRLSPSSRKIEADEAAEVLLDPRMLRIMGHELANLHLGSGNRRAAIDRDLGGRGRIWLYRAAADAAAFVVGEQEEWRKGQRKRNSAKPNGRQGR
jgi:hypothetical protein